MSCSGFSSHARGALASVALVLAASCATPTSTTHTWKAEGVVHSPMRRLVVFGGGMTEAGRRTLEDGFVGALAERGVAAKPSYELFPALPDKDRARAALQAAGFEGVLVTTLRSLRTQPEYLAGSGYNTGFWDGYYGPGWGRADLSASYVVDEEIVNVETTLWDLRASGALVWSATTKTTNPTSASDAVKSLTKDLIPKLSEGGLIPSKP